MINKIMSSKKFPNVLIISHNPLSDTQSNGKTLAAFFRQWDNSNLAHLYLSSDVPDFTVCKNFFQIHDVDILKRTLLNKQVQGRKVTYSDSPTMNIFKQRISANPFLKILRNQMSPFFVLFRDMLWDIAGYKTRELTMFVDEFKPQVVFYQSANYVFAFSITKWICQRRKIPLVMLTTDDYVTGMFTFDPFFWIQQKRVKKAFEWAVSYSDCVVAIGDKMADEYRLLFGGNYFVAMNAIPDVNLPKYIPENDTVEFLYAGNLGLNRWNVLALIAECLEELHNEEGLKGALSIYSLVEPEPKVLLHLNRPPFISFKGALDTDELNNVKAHSDVLVHVEAFDKKNRHYTRLSISTKIPEYLASGRCILAVGPDDVASMQYLDKYKLGFTVMSDKKSNIKTTLKEIITDKEKRNQFVGKAIETARLRHNAYKTAESIFQIISTTINKQDRPED